MSRLRQVLSVGWRFHPAPTPTADPGSSSTDDDEVQELTEAEFKRQSTRLVRRGLEVKIVTKGGMQMKGLFTKYPIQACEFVGFFTGSWYIPPLCTRQSRAASAPMRAAATLAALLVSRRL